MYNEFGCYEDNVKDGVSMCKHSGLNELSLDSLGWFSLQLYIYIIVYNSYIIYIVYLEMPNGCVPGCHFSQPLRVFSHHPLEGAGHLTIPFQQRWVEEKAVECAKPCGRRQELLKLLESNKESIKDQSIKSTNRPTHVVLKPPRVFSVYLFFSWLLYIYIYIYICWRRGILFEFLTSPCASHTTHTALDERFRKPKVFCGSCMSAWKVRQLEAILKRFETIMTGPTNKIKLHQKGKTSAKRHHNDVVNVKQVLPKWEKNKPYSKHQYDMTCWHLRHRNLSTQGWGVLRPKFVLGHA